MDKNAQRIAIAEASAWGNWNMKFNEVRNGKLYAHRSKVSGLVEVPNYLNDLNAMHAVVDHANATQPDNWNDEHFLMTLCAWTSGFPHRATAAQWAEAFLRTMGLWKVD